MSKIKTKDYECPLSLSIDLLTGKWKLHILWQLREHTLRFNQLKKALAPVTQKMLTQQLRELEEDGLIVRKIYPQVPPKVEYSLSSLGQGLLPIFDQLKDWGDDYARHYKIPIASPDK